MAEPEARPDALRAALEISGALSEEAGLAYIHVASLSERELAEDRAASRVRVASEAFLTALAAIGIG